MSKRNYTAIGFDDRSGDIESFSAKIQQPPSPADDGNLIPLVLLLVPPTTLLSVASTSSGGYQDFFPPVYVLSPIALIGALVIVVLILLWIRCNVWMLHRVLYGSLSAKKTVWDGFFSRGYL